MLTMYLIHSQAVRQGELLGTVTKKNIDKLFQSREVKTAGNARWQSDFTYYFFYLVYLLSLQLDFGIANLKQFKI